MNLFTFRSLLRVTAVASLLFLSGPLFSQDINYKIHAMFMYHFTRYIEWPETKKSGDFVIGVLGSSDIQHELETIAATKKAGTQTIVIKKIASGAEAAACHIVFLSSGSSSKFEETLGATAGKPVLLVAEKNGLGKKGACINFYLAEDKLRFEINKSSIESKGLKISSELLKLGTLI